MKAASLLTGVVSLGIFLTGMAAAVENPQKQITLEGVRPAVFDHETHLGNGINCGECHHKSKETPFSDQEVRAQTSGKTLSCSYCHNSKFSNERLRLVRAVMHQQCKGCHLKGYKGVKGPARCSGCHKKKKE